MHQHAQEVQLVLEIAAKLLLEPHGEKHVQQTLGYIPEVLQLPQKAQKVQFILESAAHLPQNHMERKGGQQTLG